MDYGLEMMGPICDSACLMLMFDGSKRQILDPDWKSAFSKERHDADGLLCYWLLERPLIVGQRKATECFWTKKSRHADTGRFPIQEIFV